MNTYEAFMKAADHIEKGGHYSFVGAILVPGNLDGKGCLIGWPAYFFGCPAGMFCGARDVASPKNACKEMLGVEFVEFFSRMTAISRGLWITTNSKDAAEALRRYADKYLQQEAPKDMPAEILAIFKKAYTAHDFA